MKLVKTASGKQTVKMSKSEWEEMGRKAGWIKVAIEGETPEQAAERIIAMGPYASMAANDIHACAEGQGAFGYNPLNEFQKYYPTWSREDFKKCSDILASRGL